MIRDDFFTLLGRFSQFKATLYIDEEMPISFSDAIVSSEIYDDKITIFGTGTTYVDLPGDPIIDEDEFVFETKTYRIGIICS